MKIQIEKDILLEGLQRVFSIIPQKPTLPLLSNFLFKVSSGRLYISGTDMDISITTSVECTVEEEGAVTVNAKRFISIVRELSPGEVTISVSDEQVTVEFKNGTASIMGMSAADFPALKETIEGVPVSLPGADLVEMVDKTTFSVSQDRTRLALTGIYWKITANDMIMVSTDGHRLSLLGRKMKVNTEGGAEAIIPPKCLNQASQIIAGGTDIEKIVFGERAILFDFGTTVIFSKLIEGPYPNFRQVIPMANSKKVYVSTRELAAVVRRVSVISSTMTHQIRMSLTPNTMELSSTNEDIGGESRETLDVRYDGDNLSTGYNAAFLAEILRKIETDEIVIELETPTTACIIKPVDQKEKDEYTYLIMPLRLSE